MSIVCIIPARAGSKGVPDKNIKLLAGKPLVVHTIEHAQVANNVDRVIVSTDGDAIAQIAKEAGAEVIRRPASLATDTATSEAALLHALEQLSEEPDLIVFLQCTSPLRSRGDIDAAINTLRRNNADSLLSVVESHAFLWGMRDGKVQSLNYDYEDRPRRQDREREYRENGSIYVFKPWVLRQYHNRLGGIIALYEMAAWTAVDIDTPHDFTMCECILERQ